MKHSLPFKIKLNEKYNEVNVESFIDNFHNDKKDKVDILLKEDLLEAIDECRRHSLSTNEVVELAIRYAFNKREFKNMLGYIIQHKREDKNNWDSFIL